MKTGLQSIRFFIACHIGTPYMKIRESNPNMLLRCALRRGFCKLAMTFTLVFALSVSVSAHAHQDGHESAAQSEKALEQLIENALSDESKVVVSFSNKTIVVEFADSAQERALGLMYRRSMCTDCGMLFEFDNKKIGSIWMKNTYIPLDLAYIDSDGTIIDIFQLAPFDLTPVMSSQPVLYALEMNVGWFAKHDIKPGHVIEITAK